MEGEKRPAEAEAPEVAGGERRRVFREWKGRRDMVKWKSVGSNGEDESLSPSKLRSLAY